MYYLGFVHNLNHKFDAVDCDSSTLHNVKCFSENVLLLTKAEEKKWYQDRNNKIYHEDWFYKIIPITISQTSLFFFGRYPIVLDYPSSESYVVNRFDNTLIHIDFFIEKNNYISEIKVSNYIAYSRMKIKKHRCIDCEKEFDFFEGRIISSSNITSLRYQIRCFTENGSDFSFLCGHCYDKNKYKCDICDNRNMTKEIQYTKFDLEDEENNIIVTKNVCASCNQYFKPCSKCGNIYYTNTHMLDIEGDYICMRCKNKTIKCDVCKNTIDVPNIFFNQYYCDICISAIVKKSPSINSYGFKPEPYFFKNTSKEKKIYFGCELEMDINSAYPKESLVENIYSKCNTDKGKIIQYLYAKNDSSLKNHGESGMEIVTHPMTYNFIITHLDVFNKLFSCKELGCVSFESPNCGMHVHMNKSKFTPSQIYRIALFILLNKKYILNIAERKEVTTSNGCSAIDTYCNFDYLTTYTNLKAVCKLKTHSRDYRHSVINFCNDKTIEFRMFKGTLEIDRFLKNIQFCLSLYNYTYESPIARLNISKFEDYIFKNRLLYSHLFSFINNK